MLCRCVTRLALINTGSPSHYYAAGWINDAPHSEPLWCRASLPLLWLCAVSTCILIEAPLYCFGSSDPRWLVRCTTTLLNGSTMAEHCSPHHAASLVCAKCPSLIVHSFYNFAPLRSST